MSDYSDKVAKNKAIFDGLPERIQTRLIGVGYTNRGKENVETAAIMVITAQEIYLELTGEQTGDENITNLNQKLHDMTKLVTQLRAELKARSEEIVDLKSQNTKIRDVVSTLTSKSQSSKPKGTQRNRVRSQISATAFLQGKF